VLELLLVILSTVTGIDRNVDASLTASAQHRAESVTCASDQFFTHAGKPDNVAEILVCFPNGADDAQHAADAWMASPPHRAVLTNPAYRRIGCGAAVTGQTVLIACHLATGVPNTALPHDSGLLTAAGVLLIVGASAIRRRRIGLP
jgi:hypothetical protein